jgi:hypothetical protein
MSHRHPDAESINAARRDLVSALALLTMPTVGENTLAARNLDYHAQELCRWLDAFYSGQEPDELPGGL